MEFEGLKIDNAENVRRHLESLRTTHPRDNHPWEWLGRFLRAHPEHKPWAEAAMLAMAADDMPGGELRPTDTAVDLLRIAASNRIWCFRPLIEKQLGAEGDSSDPEVVRWLLDKLLEAAGAFPLDSRVVSDIARHGRRKGCFNTALSLMGHASRDAASEFLCAELPSALKRKERGAMDAAAFCFGFHLQAPQRKRVAHMIAAQMPRQVKPLRESIAKNASMVGKAEELLAEFDMLIKEK